MMLSVFSKLIWTWAENITILCHAWRVDVKRLICIVYSLNISFEEARATTRSTGRARGLTVREARRSQPRRQPICRPYYAMRRPISAREHSPRPSPRYFAVLRFFGPHSPSVLRGRRSSCSRQALAPGEPRLHSRHRRPRRRRQMEQKGGDTSSLARCHQNTRNTLVKALRARESNATT